MSADQCLIDMIRSLADPADAKHVARTEAAAARVERRLVEDRRRPADRAHEDRLVGLGLDIYDQWRTIAKVNGRQADSEATLNALVEEVKALRAELETLKAGKGKHGPA